MDNKKYLIPKDNLSNYVAESLPTPFPSKNSVSRLAMYKSALSHSVSPAINPERPLVDSIYSKNLIISSDNYRTKGKVRLLARIDKVIRGMVTEVCYIYYDYHLNEIDMDIIPKYEKYYKFGYEIKSELENMEIDQISDGPVYTKYTYNMDPEDGGMAYGKNLNVIYSCSRDVGEDAIIITDRVAKECALNYFDEVEMIYYPELNGLKDLYGKYDEDGNWEYRPFPLPGEYAYKEALICTSNIGNNFLAITNEVQDADNTKYVHKGAMVIDVEVYSNNSISNSFLEELRLAQKKYIQEINSKLNRLKVSDGQFFSDSLRYKAMRYQSLANDELRVSSLELKKKIYIKIKTVDTKPLGPGDKLTNRDGGKGTVCMVVPDNIIAEDGTKIDAIINVTGLVNRENPGQIFEKELNTLNVFLRKYLNESKDSNKVKFNNIIKWVQLAHCTELADELKRYKNHDEIVELFKVENLTLKYDPYDSSFGLMEYHKLRLFTSSLYPDTRAMKISMDGYEFSERHVYGKAFYMMLENGPRKDTSIRADGMQNIKGALSKKGASRKRHQTKWGTTATKISDLGLSIMLNFFKPTDKDLLQNNTNILNDYLQGLGIKFVLEKKKEE